jgi:hypothetical protein
MRQLVQAATVLQHALEHVRRLLSSKVPSGFSPQPRREHTSGAACVPFLLLGKSDRSDCTSSRSLSFPGSGSLDPAVAAAAGRQAGTGQSHREERGKRFPHRTQGLDRSSLVRLPLPLPCPQVSPRARRISGTPSARGASVFGVEFVVCIISRNEVHFIRLGLMT